MVVPVTGSRRGVGMVCSDWIVMGAADLFANAHWMSDLTRERPACVCMYVVKTDDTENTNNVPYVLEGS